MNKIAHYRCSSCGCEMAVYFVGMEPLPDVECQECHKRVRQEVATGHFYYEKILDWVRYESEQVAAEHRLEWMGLVREAVNEIADELGEK